MKLEHIQNYFSSKLQIEILNYKSDYVGIRYSTANGFYFLNGKLYIMYTGGSTGKSIEEFKPILHPLSDLGKDRYNFLYENETDYDSIKDWFLMDSESRLTSKFSYSFWQTLFHYHFDVFGLIESGLAIDVNTLDKNPYE